MSESISQLSFVNNRKTGTKIATGFAVVLLILAVSSILSISHSDALPIR
jgi:hypothetical protein